MRFEEAKIFLDKARLMGVVFSINSDKLGLKGLRKMTKKAAEYCLMEARIYKPELMALLQEEGEDNYDII